MSLKLRELLRPLKIALVIHGNSMQLQNTAVVGGENKVAIREEQSRLAE